MLLVAADSPLAARETAPPLRELRGLSLIGWRSVRDMEELLRGRIPEVDFVFRTDDNYTMMGLVAAGVGAAVVPGLVVDPNAENIAALPFGTRVPPRVIALAWHRDRYRSDAARAFVETAQEVVGELAPAPAA